MRFLRVWHCIVVLCIPLGLGIAATTICLSKLMAQEEDYLVYSIGAGLLAVSCAIASVLIVYKWANNS